MKTLKRYCQQGYTLIELMIAGTLGLILLLGVMMVYLSTSRTNQLQAGLIEIQDKGRFLLTFIEKDLQRAGWSNLDPGVNLGTLSAHIIFTGPDASTNNTGYQNSDSITIQYESNDEVGINIVYDCDGGDALGNPIPDGDLIQNQYTVVNGTLLCNGRPLLNDVESMQILYGVETATTLPDGIVDGYITAAQIAGYETRVVTVRIALLITTSSNVLDQVNANSYQVLDESFAAVNDLKLRRIFVKTIVLPNRPQAF